MSTFFLFPRGQKLVAGLGLGMVLLCALLGFFFPTTFFEGYLTAFVFWVEIALGCMALLFLQYLTGGLWGACLTRILEAGMMTLPWCGLLFLPLFLGLPYLFPWIHPVGSELQHLVQQKAAYLNVPFYAVRFCIYFLVLSALALWFRRLSLKRDGNESAAFRHDANLERPVSDRFHAPDELRLYRLGNGAETRMVFPACL